MDVDIAMGMGDTGAAGSGSAEFFWTLFCFPLLSFLIAGGSTAVDGDAGKADGCPVPVWSPFGTGLGGSAVDADFLFVDLN